MAQEPLKATTMPRRFSLIAAIFLGAIAAAQGARIYFGNDIQIDAMHIPMGVSWAVAIVFAVVAVLAFREAEG